MDKWNEVIGIIKNNGNSSSHDDLLICESMLKNRLPRFYEKVSNDEQLDAKKIFEFISDIDNKCVTAAQQEEFVSYVATACHNNQKKGVPRDCSALFGHVISWEKLKGGMQASPFTAWTQLSRSEETWIQDFLRLEIEAQRLLLEVLFPENQLTTHQMWSFHQDDYPKKPFKDVNLKKEELVRRLGLGSLKDHVGEVLYVTFKLESSHKPCRPTCFDTEPDNDWFHPGGRSKTLSEPDDGLLETVHHSVSSFAMASKFSLAS